MADLGLFYPEGHQAHAQPGHPERPERVEVVRDSLQEAGIWQDGLPLEPLNLAQGLLERVHAPSYLETLEAASRSGQPLDLDTYTTAESWGLALQAAGGAAGAAEAVWDGKVPAALALTRPPGHHARSDRGMGFCLLNNAALAAEYLIQDRNAERLAVVDIDLHHGNGTQEIFWDRDDVLYFSAHQHPFYPGTGKLAETGAGAGEGWTVNVPLPAGSGDRAYAELTERVLLPALDSFRPELVLISYGYDAHYRDPLGGLRLSGLGYYRVIKALADWAGEHCGGRVVVLLEGGYDLEAGRVCSQAAAAALLHQPWEDPLGPAPGDETSRWVSAVDRAAARYKS
jgi:acetoin utilization deacetylase AcuC-like enzyme